MTALPNTQHATLASVVLPTHNRAALLERALASLVAQRLDPGDIMEIVVVDDRSTDGTAAVLAAARAAHPAVIRTVAGEGIGPAAARNAGIRSARGAYVAFTDDDQIADPGWLAALLRVARARGARCVLGCRLLVLPPDHALPLDRRLRVFFGEDIFGEGERTLGARELPNTGNALLARSVFDEVGVFDVRQDECAGAEDAEFFTRVRLAGVPMWYTPAAVLHHVIPPDRMTARYLRSRAERDGITKALINHQHGRRRTLWWEVVKWHAVALRGRRWLRRPWTAADAHFAQYLAWNARGYAIQTLALAVPRAAPLQRYLWSRRFRAIHKAGV